MFGVTEHAEFTESRIYSLTFLTFLTFLTLTNPVYSVGLARLGGPGIK